MGPTEDHEKKRHFKSYQKIKVENLQVNDSLIDNLSTEVMEAGIQRGNISVS